MTQVMLQTGEHPLPVKTLLDAGVHFGHQTKRWNPKMRAYIYGARNGVHIIDLDKTERLFTRAYSFVAETVGRGGHILMVGTKRQAQEIVQEEAQRSGSFYVVNRWLGGTLTNFRTIKQGLDRLRQLERMKDDGTHYQLSDSPALPKPAQQPRPPIVMGGHGAKRTPRLAARYADEFNLPFAPVSMFRDSCDRVRAACEKIDRDPASMRYTAALVVCVGTNEAEFERRAKAIGHAPDQLRANAAAGLPGEVVESLQRFADEGAETAYLQVLDLDDLDHVRLIASEIAPHV